jgi:hypothetical protein
LYYGRGKLPAVPQKPTKSDDDILKQQYRYVCVVDVLPCGARVVPDVVMMAYYHD